MVTDHQTLRLDYLLIRSILCRVLYYAKQSTNFSKVILMSHCSIFLVTDMSILLAE